MEKEKDLDNRSDPAALIFALRVRGIEIETPEAKDDKRYKKVVDLIFSGFTAEEAICKVYGEMG